MSVLLETSLGDIVIDLFTDKCPLATKNFIKLCKIKYYNGAMFYDIQKDYLARVLNNKKESTSIYEILYGEQAKYFDDEIDPDRRHDQFGLVSTANIGPNLNNSNFFITLSYENLESLNGKHTIFGQVAEGLDILQKINETFVDENNRPYYNIRILHTLVLDDPFEDPKGLIIPNESPILIYDDADRLDINDQIELLDDKKRTEEEIIEATKEHEAKTKAIVLEMLNDLPDADIKPPDNVLFVCKLNPVTTESDLELIFSRFGPIKSCEIIRDWKTGQSLQYAFIEFETNAACEEAYFKMENALIDERRIHVDFSQSVAKYWYRYKGNKGSIKGKDKIIETQGTKKPKVELKEKHRPDTKYSMVFDEMEKKNDKEMSGSGGGGDRVSGGGKGRGSDVGDRVSGGGGRDRDRGRGNADGDDGDDGDNGGGDYAQKEKKTQRDTLKANEKQYREQNAKTATANPIQTKDSKDSNIKRREDEIPSKKERNHRSRSRSKSYERRHKGGRSRSNERRYNKGRSRSRERKLTSQRNPKREEKSKRDRIKSKNRDRSKSRNRSRSANKSRNIKKYKEVEERTKNEVKTKHTKEEIMSASKHKKHQYGKYKSSSRSRSSKSDSSNSSKSSDSSDSRSSSSSNSSGSSD